MKKNVDKIMMGRDAVKSMSVRGKVFAAVAWVAMSLTVVGLLGGCADDVSFEWMGRSNGYVVSLVDDSLALLYNEREYQECTDGGFMGYGDCVNGSDNSGLFLVNYREKKNVYWGDTVDYPVLFMRGFYRDSTVFFLKNREKEFGFWKIGNKPSSTKKIEWHSPCTGLVDYSKTKFRPWKDGNILVIQAKGCDLAVLDTATGDVVEIKNDDLKNNCDDMSYKNDVLICFKAIYANDYYGTRLFVNFELTDSLVWKSANWSLISEDNIEILGDMLLINHPTTLNDLRGNVLAGKNVNSINPLKPLNPFVKLDFSTFIDSSGNKLLYRSSDLFVSGNK
ncbi:MAG: hypothetical protein HUK21_05145 [Fibrobacteraceae bacterium]|nr:hypothetical protein [Fibrobacteraceae bacterium]